MHGRFNLEAVLFSSVLAFTIANGEEPKNIADRLIVEIGSSPFTQREIEIHFLTSCIMRQIPEKNCVINAANWPEILKIFSDDMILRQQAGSMLVQQAPPKAIEKATNDVEKKIDSYPPLKAARQRLQISQKDIKRSVNEIFGIESFKQRKSQLDNSDESASSHANLEAKKKTLVRKLADADKYVELSATPASPGKKSKVSPPP